MTAINVYKLRENTKTPLYGTCGKKGAECVTALGSYCDCQCGGESWLTGVII